MKGARRKSDSLGEWDERYARQLALPEIGRKGQAILQRSAVLVIGAGGLGSPAAYYLAGAGIGRLGVADHDRVELSNLQRQTLHGTRDVGRLKVESAARKLRGLNPGARIEAIGEKIVRDNAMHLLSGYDFVIDATDNFASKFLIADTCHALRLPYSHAGISRFAGQTMTVLPGRSCCCRCLLGEAPAEDGALQGPLGAVPGVIGAIQATEAIKFLLGIGTLLTDRLLMYDALAMTFRLVSVMRNEECPLCGKPPGVQRKNPATAEKRNVKP
jgi:molybdopterin/thiamine biosynthesis adenylyltransferase